MTKTDLLVSAIAVLRDQSAVLLAFVEEVSTVLDAHLFVGAEMFAARESRLDFGHVFLKRALGVLFARHPDAFRPDWDHRGCRATTSLRWRYQFPGPLPFA